ncbi:MAG TPA: hypothetical protein VN813_01370 [Luteibacter sp.]|nr:hypothetical protein [Luteibacter sp.]
MHIVNARLSLFAIILSLGIAGPALAAPPQKAAALPSFEEMDKDNDGIVTLPEIMVYPDPIASIVKSCDADNDSKLTRAEYASCEAVTKPSRKPAP